MLRSHRKSLLSHLSCALAVAGMTLGPAIARADEEPAPNQGSVSFSGGIDFTGAYFYRGLAQENQGFIYQPWFEVVFNLYSDENAAINSFDVFAGTWNSVHHSAPSTGGNDWFESDAYVGFTIGLPANFSYTFSFTHLASPATGASFTDEISGSIAYDDSGFWTDAPMEFGGFQPYVTIVKEISNQSDLGGGSGWYMELGIEPSIKILPNESFEVTLAFPIKIGLSLDDYYNDGMGNDDTFGYVQFGPLFSTPISFIPSRLGAWELTAGVQFIYLGEATENIGGPGGFGVTDGDAFQWWWTVGLSFSY